MTREQWHILLDEALENGFSKEMQWGSCILEVKFERGKEVIRIRERETIKPKGEA